MEWVWGLLFRLGLWKKSATLLLLGLDNAGKTTLLNKLKYGWIRSFVPTQRAQLEELTVGNVTFKAWDLGGHLQVRNLWRDYYIGTDAIVFVIDSSDEERFGEVQQELLPLLSDEHMTDTVVMILANKSDLVPRITTDDLIEKLGIQTFVSPHNQARRAPTQVFIGSLVKDTGYVEGFDWLSKVI